MRVASFLWDDDNIDHIATHGVAQWEIEQVLRRRPKVRRTREGRYQAAGTTEDGRFLLVHFRYLGSGVVRPITARDMTLKERRSYARK
ncbi:MAG: BrnT family toxin [Candidatus Tectomicrobia bacterium]|uniref:BrnT family toxin n=1 Tax=Tectimicrobiota bacterium TaxID=2528274 RepID=A0A932GMP8_UNCTE|nr:BrnT family toxin [Candidatus Tectomicrobia bacterium]